MIYLIAWVGRDCETGIWDTYPCYDEGYFTDKDKATQHMHLIEKRICMEWDGEAEEFEHYTLIEIHKHMEANDD